MSRPSNRRGPGRVSVQVARPGSAGGAGGADEVPTRGRHRSPDAEGAPVLAASSLVGAPRHRRARRDPADEPAPGPAGLPARSLERVDAAREAAARPATVPPAPGVAAARAVPTTGAAGSEPTAPVVPAEDAVTDLVARPGRGALPDGPGTGPQPAVLGCAVSVVALVATVVAAAVPAPGGSAVTLYGVLAVALLGTATAALGLGRQRPRRALAATGVVVGAAAVVAGVLPLLAL
ncbi:hypothetical protein [Actinomycetospora soli]|uniref:hypothetical protein n=1 Tax=Actinomycetospora soli TaxID=2893887 RepID=UPI001E41E01D|nr:hypothetical protein [Actinomycetospora soli]MCD2186373.1 hypothetical protein [Actinomycetospora soli]